MYSYDRRASLTSDDPGLRQRQAAYNIAKDLSRGQTDLRLTKRGKDLALKYYLAEDRSKPISERIAAAKALLEYLDAELDYSKIATRVLENYDRLFTEALAVFHGIQMDEEYSSKKPIPGEERYVDLDEDTHDWCVFGEKSGFAYASFSDKSKAEAWLKENPR